MGDYFPYFIGGGFIVVIIILFSRKKQNERMSEFVKDADEVPQIFLEQAINNKLRAIYGKLYVNGVKNKVAEDAGTLKLELVQELQQLEAEYAEKKITQREYSDKLQQLHLRVMEL